MGRMGLAERTDQLGAVAVNAAQLLLHGGFETGEEGSPFDVIAHEPMYRLRRYFPECRQDRMSSGDTRAADDVCGRRVRRGVFVVGGERAT